MEAQQSDLATRARIRNAALDGFVQGGFTTPSIRQIALTAGVSVGSVQHFFPSKAALREAVNDYVAAIVRDAFGVVVRGSSPTEVTDELGDRIVAFIAEHPTAVRYLARSLVEGDVAAVALFDALVGFARDQLLAAERDGLLPADVDQLWAAMHAVILNVATVLLEDRISPHLPDPLRSPAGLERWRLAQTALFRGLYRGEHP
jgi:AcrR family transcriptional regulator